MYTATDGKPPILPTGPISFIRSIDEEFKGLQLFRQDDFRLAAVLARNAAKDPPAALEPRALALFSDRPVSCSGDRRVSAALQDAADVGEDLRRAGVVDVGNKSGHGVGIDRGSRGIALNLEVPADAISCAAAA